MWACFLSMQAEAQTAPVKRGDTRVVNALKQIKTNYEMQGNTYKVTYELSNKRSQNIFIISETDKVYGLEVRGVFAWAMISDNQPSQEVANLLLQQNMENISAWAIQKTDDGKAFIIVNIVYIPANSDGKRLEAAMLSVAQAADEMEQRLTKKDEF